MNVREVAAPPAGDQDLPSRLRIVLQQQNPPTPLSRNRCTHQTRRARAQHDHIEFPNFSRHTPIVAEDA